MGGQVSLGILLYHLADIGMRAVGFATIMYALDWWGWVAAPFGLAAWLAFEHVAIRGGGQRSCSPREAYAQHAAREWRVLRGEASPW